MSAGGVSPPAGVPAGPAFGPLVTPAWLAAHLTEPDVRVYDCTGRLVHGRDDGRPGTHAGYRAESGRAAYDAGHVPGAGYLDVAGALSAPAGEGLYAAPAPDRFAAAVGAAGIGPGTRVVLYSQGRPSWATRVWWLLRYFGFDAVAVLDGGWEAWVRDGRSVSAPVARADSRTAPGGAPTYPPARFVATQRPALLATTEDVARTLARPGGAAGAARPERACLVNALSPAQHAGADPAHFGRPGHIPGSLNVPYLELLDPGTGTFLPAAALRARFAAAGALDAPRVVAYCGGGIGATAVALALAAAGRWDAAVYDGSLLAWAADPARPLVTAAVR